jgi:hypothetical protein
VEHGGRTHSWNLEGGAVPKVATWHDSYEWLLQNFSMGITVLQTAVPLTFRLESNTNYSWQCTPRYIMDPSADQEFYDFYLMIRRALNL